MTSPAASYLSIREVSCFYNDTQALASINIDVREGELLTLLGPSGCGKSTLLLILGGFLAPAYGRITLAGKDLVAEPAHRRNIGFVFQNYALFPHLSVLDNVCYPLRMRGVPRLQMRARARGALERVGLAAYGDRSIQAMSGGQRQRVALARAVVAEPRLLLMDEPLSALDKTLREEMQREIRSLQQHLGVTTIYVTHDQREAMAMADRIAVMNGGSIEQLDTAEVIYRYPKSPFVAAFMGHASLLPLASLKAQGPELAAAMAGSGRRAVVRAEEWSLAPPDMQRDWVELDGVLESSTYQGDYWRRQVRLPCGRSVNAHLSPATIRGRVAAAQGMRVRLYAALAGISYVDAPHDS